MSRTDFPAPKISILEKTSLPLKKQKNRLPQKRTKRNILKAISTRLALLDAEKHGSLSPLSCCHICK
jgi:hypothetical protein